MNHLQAADPDILLQPVGGRAAVGENFSFAVVPVGTGPFTYQWYFNNKYIALATNAVLVRTNLTTAYSGTYLVQVRNARGWINSTGVTLSVTATAPRGLLNGTVTGSGQAEIPVQLVGNGFENGFSFSLRFDPAKVQNPTFTSERPGATVTLDGSRLGEGFVGVTLVLPAGTTFARTNQTAGRFRFDLVGGATPMQAGISFTNVPVALQARDVDGNVLILDSDLVPSVEMVQPAPVLNHQSGLYEERVILGNPGPLTMTNVEVGVYGLGVDSQTNAITLYNAVRVTMFDLDLDSKAETQVEEIVVPTLAPGEVVTLTLEYYVTDHLTVPQPNYLVKVPPGSAFTQAIAYSQVKTVISDARHVDGTFLLQFNTRTDSTYYVQYADSVAGLEDPNQLRTASPAIEGTGGTVLWIDNGPPKTISPPTAGMRFYRVIRIE